MPVLQDESQIQNPLLTLAEFFIDFIDEPTRAIMHQKARFLFIKKGKGRILIDGRDYLLRAPCLISVMPYSITDIINVEKPLVVEIIAYDFLRLSQTIKSLKESHKEKLVEYLSHNPIIYLNAKEFINIKTIFEVLRIEILTECEDKKPFHNIYILNKLIEMIILYRRYSMNDNCLEMTIDDKDPHHILSYIYTHSFEKLTLDKLSAAFYLSVSKIIKTINELTGLTFGELLERIQMDKLKSILLYTDMSLNEIAHLMGYVDASHISKHFIQAMGISPIAFRKQYQHIEKGESDFNHRLALQVTEYIYNNYTDTSLNISKVATKFGVSEKQLNNAMNYYVERKLDQLLHKVRIGKACELILRNEKTILDIALEVGYANVKTFNIHFNEITCMSPSEYRKSICLQLKNGKELISR